MPRKQHLAPKMVISNGSAKKRGRPGGATKEEKRTTPHPIDAGDDLERARQPMRMEEPPLCGWKGCLHADGRAIPMATMIFEFLFANFDAKLRRRCGMSPQRLAQEKWISRARRAAFLGKRGEGSGRSDIDFDLDGETVKSFESVTYKL